ncbi:MAG: hypothetical protein WBA97_28055 [Actinophytocola sp.]|uniref:hypothetical protein n=1 Tax=Actinophytocola sp. TaxID=1872138 RepID=UPI003C76C24D
MIGHSQGNLEIRWAVKWWTSLQPKVDDAVLLASPNNGDVLANLGCVLPCYAAGSQFSLASNFITALNDGDKTPGPISYTNLYSTTDALVPVASAPLDTATNISIQSVCPLRAVTHGGMLYDAVTYLLAVDALTNSGTASPSRLPANKCSQTILPYLTVLEAALTNAALLATAVVRLGLADVVTAEPALKPYAT